MWQIDCAINTAKALLPFQDQLRSVKHRIRPPSLNRGHDLVLKGAFEHLAALEAVGLPIAGKHVLEIGSGWFPILPLVFRAAGAERIYLTDAHRLLRRPTLDLAVAFVLRNRRRVATALNRPESEVVAAVSPPENLDFDAALNWLGFHYRAPFDRADPLPPVDVVISHTVLEHIPEPVIRQIFADMRAQLKPGGFMVHGVDNTDHRPTRTLGSPPSTSCATAMRSGGCCA